jgi:thioredoxin-like negative regulator of GroEL
METGQPPGALGRGIGMGRSRARWWLVVVLWVVTGVLLWGGWRWWQFRRHRRAIAEVGTEIKAGLYRTAARKLMAILARKPDSDEAAYLLGTLEMARGRPQAAFESWARIPTSSRFAARSIRGQIQVEVDRGRFAEAEQIIKDVLADPRNHGSGFPIFLGPLYGEQGRLEECLRLIEARWDHLNETGQGSSEKAIILVQLHIELQRTIPPVEAIRSVLDQAARLAPEDDRMWLGRANLAIRTGSYDEAARWLDGCLRRRPVDVPVWRARLDWAVATNRVAEAQEALKHLPVKESTPAQIARLGAWFAARRGDIEAERRALELLIDADPTDFNASERLAELDVRAGHPERAAELRDKKSEIERLRARYLKLYVRNQPMRDAAAMASLAEQLGRWFEARVFLTVAIAADPDRDDCRRELVTLDQRRGAIGGQDRTLADLIALIPMARADPSTTPATCTPTRRATPIEE